MNAIVHFRVMARGGYKWLKPGQSRGYWRVLVVRDVSGCIAVSARNVLDVLYTGPEGIDGVTDRSAYYLGHSRVKALQIAADWNAAQRAQACAS